MDKAKWPYGYGMCHCGCGQRTNIIAADWDQMGYVKGEPHRFLHGHFSRTCWPTAEERFWAKVDKRGPDECWPWTGGTKGSAGHGVFWSNGKLVGAHRFAYTLSSGPIPDGHVVMHTCDHGRCVNPAHLRVGRYTDNTADMILKGRGGTAALSPDDVRAIRRAYTSGQHTQTGLGREYGVSQTTIWRIVRGRAWRCVA